MNKNIYWPFIILSYASLLSVAMIDNSRGPVYPNILKHFEVSLNYGSLIFSLSTLMGLLTSATSKYWLKAIGVIQSISLGSLIMFLGSISYYAIPQFNLSFIYLLACSIFLGSGISLIAISMNILISEGSSEDLRRKGYAGLHAIYGFGSLLAPLLFSLWIDNNQKWQLFFLVLAIIPMFPFFYSLSVLKSSNIKEKISKELIAPIHYPYRIIFGLMFGFYVSSEILISSRLVLFLRQLHSFENQQAQYYLSLFFAFLFLGRISFVFVSSSISSFKAMLTSLILSLTFSLLGLSFHPLFLCLTGLSMSFFFPVGMDWLNKKFPKGIEFMTGSVFTWISVMLVLIHSLFGLLAETYGIQQAFLLAPLLLMGSLVLLFKLDRFKPIRRD
ncbi:MAG: MFS transporter [Bacteriovoracaceae bacterium]|nr:MFS transporter [Bacteriovoracaceae bacterium]